MSKRSGKFKRNKRDLYNTPAEAVAPLLSHLGDVQGYIEPCVGEGCLVRALDSLICAWETDLPCDATSFNYLSAWSIDHLGPVSHFITNPPWTRQILHPIIENLSNQLPTWILLDSDWAHTKQKALAKRIGCKTVPELLERCVKIVSVGRVSWMQNGVSGFDNCCWYLFDKNFTGQTEFYGRTQRKPSEEGLQWKGKFSG